MKSLCIGFLGADWWGSDARAMAVELRRRGHRVIERNYEDYVPTRWRHPTLRLLRRLLRPLLAADYKRSVEELLRVPGMDLLLVFKGMHLAKETLARFRERGVRCVCFYPDVSFRDHGRNIPECLPLYDCVFTTKRYHLGDPWLAGRVRELVFAPHGFDPDVHRPLGSAAEQPSPYRCDVSFVGVWSPKKESLVAALCRAMPELDLRIWGPGWGSACREVSARWEGRGAYSDETAAIYSDSRINLGLLSEAGSGTASGDQTTARTWQIPAAGGFLLHEDTPEVREVFRDGEDIALFSSPEHLVEQVKRHLPDAEGRARIAASGRQVVLQRPMTYAPAVDIVLSWCEERASADTAPRRVLRAAYVGILGEGTTSRMRAEALRGIDSECTWDWIDTDAPMRTATRVSQSLAFRLRIGPAVGSVNRLVKRSLARKTYDLVWVDKGVLLRGPAMRRLRSAAWQLVHYTPDTAFRANRSRFFRRHIGLYDFLVTTKSFETSDYLMRVAPRKLLYATQGYDPSVHRISADAGPRRREVGFLGLAEPDRESCVAALLEAGVTVNLGGVGWDSFVERWKDHKHLRFVGREQTGEDYARFFSGVWVGLGLLTKRFGELHTTRTFEIPACGAILATEVNAETSAFFREGEALFFEDHQSLARELRRLFDHARDEELARIARAGRERVIADGRDYPSILRSVLRAAAIPLANET